MMPRFLGEQIHTAQRERTSAQDLVDRFSVAGSLDLRTATTEERKVVMQYLRSNAEAMNPSVLEEFLEAAVTYHDITLEEVEEYLRVLPAEQCYVFAVFILQVQPQLALGDLFLFCYYKLSREDQRELREFAIAQGGDASLLVTPNKTMVKEFLNETHSFGRVQEYLGYLVRSAERFEDPRVLEVLQYFVDNTQALFPCVIPHITSLKRLGVEIDAPEVISTDVFFNHFNREVVVGRNRLLPVKTRVDEELVSDTLLETRQVWSKTLPEALVRNFITLPSYARHVESIRPNSGAIVEYLGGYIEEYTIGEVFAHPESLARLIQYEKEHDISSQTSVKKYLVDLVLHGFSTTADLSYFVVHLEKYETMLGRSFHAELSDWYEENPLSFGSRLDLVQNFKFDGKESWLIKNGNIVQPSSFPLIVDSYARLEKQKSFTTIEKELLVCCPFVFSSITLEALAHLSSAEILTGIEHAAKFSCASDVMQKIVEQLGFETICTHLEKRGISVSCLFVKNLLPFVSDKEFGRYVHLYSHERPDLLRALSPERILRLPLNDCVEYYQVLLRHRDFISLRMVYEQSVVDGARTREHRDFIWSLLARHISSDRELFVTLISRAIAGVALRYHADHYQDLLKIAEEKLISFVQEKPTLLFDPSIGALVDDLSFATKEEFLALQQHFSVIADVKNFSKATSLVCNHETLESCISQYDSEDGFLFTHIADKLYTPKKQVSWDSLISSDRDLLIAARYMIGTPLYQQFKDMGGKIPDSHLTKAWLSQFEQLVMHDDFDESIRPLFTFQQFDAEVTRRMQGVAYRELGLRGGLSEKLEDREAMLVYAEYAHIHAKHNPELSHAIVKYAPFVFSEHFETWKSFGILQELHGSTPAMLHKGFEGMQRKRLLPTNLSFEQYEKWVETMTVSEDDRHEHSIVNLRNAIVQAVRNGIYNEQIPAYVYEGNSGIEKRYRGLREEYLQLKKEERFYKKEYPQEKKMPLAVHRHWLEVKNQLKHFREQKHDLLREYTTAYYILRLSKISVDEVKRGILKIPDAEVSLVDVLSHVRGFVGDAGSSIIDLIGSYIRDTHNAMKVRGMLSRKVLSATDVVDRSALISCGRKPCVTCQNADSVFSTGLLSVIVDPHVRLLQVYAGGELVGRAVMRLLHTVEGDPAIFVERVYKSLTSEHVDDLLYAIAIKKGLAMGVPVYGEDETTYVGRQKGRVQPKKAIMLLNNASRSPMNFSDAALGKGVESGQFRIHHVRNNTHIHS